MRTSDKKRTTSETDISVELNIDGTGISDIDTGIGFLDHMLILMTKHGLFDLKVRCEGDTFIDFHHTVEDIGITIGQAFKEAVGDKAGIVRYANTYTPMDECLSLVVLDLGGRTYLNLDVVFIRDTVGNFDTELVEEFFRGFANHCDMNLHIKMIESGNTHHMIESIFKGFGRTLDRATQHDPRIEGVMSTKGTI